MLRGCRTVDRKKPPPKYKLDDGFLVRNKKKRKEKKRKTKQQKIKEKER